MKLNKKLATSVLAALALYLVSTGVSYALFRYLKTPPSSIVSPLPDQTSGSSINLSGPKTESCPLTALKYTKAEREIWEKRRPLLVMIENHVDARPQSGLSKADVVYEAVAEGGITRFMAVFYCDAAAQEVIVGPVRSARTYFLDWASEYGGYPLYAHVGGAHCDPQTGHGCLNGAKADALGQIERYGWGGPNGNDLNQFSIGFPTFWRDYERLGRTVATEHTMYSTTEKLWAVAKKRGWTNLDPQGESEWIDHFTPWKFNEKQANENTVQDVSFYFWQGHSQYDVRWHYNPETQLFERFNGGQPHKDRNNDQQLTTKNLIIQFCQESPANDGYPGNLHLLYKNTGSGKALVFKNGQVIEAKWSKKDRLSRTFFTDLQGQEIEFAPGKIWIEILPAGNQVTY